MYVKGAKKVTMNDVKNFLRKRFNTSPHIWLESGEERKGLERIVKDSLFGKRFG